MKKDSEKKESPSETEKSAEVESDNTPKASNRRMVVILVLILLVLAGGGLWYYSSKTGQGITDIIPITGDSPTKAYKRLFAAVKSKNTESIKAQMTKKSIDFAGMASQRNNTPIEKVFENGFTATTFSETLPTIRDERIKDNMGAVEVWNTKESKWEDLPFILEDGAWKLAVGDLFAGTFVSPGRGRDSLEKEAANALDPNRGMIPAPAPNSNVNNTQPQIIKPKPMPSVK